MKMVKRSGMVQGQMKGSSNLTLCTRSVSSRDGYFSPFAGASPHETVSIFTFVNDIRSFTAILRHQLCFLFLLIKLIPAGASPNETVIFHRVASVEFSKFII